MGLYTYKLHKIEDDISKTYKEKDLLLMTTFQLREICAKEKLVKSIVNPLDKEELIKLIMKYRGEKDNRLVNNYIEDGLDNIEKFIKEVSKKEVSSNVTDYSGKIIIYENLSMEIYDDYELKIDGEIEEGQIWEAAMTASKYRLNRLIAILDHNKVQMSGTNEEIMPLGDIKDKFDSFGWKTYKINGHSISEIIEILDHVTQESHEEKSKQDKPVMIIANTVKGKGVSFMEGKAEWHGAVPTEEQYDAALTELGKGESNFDHLRT